MSIASDFSLAPKDLQNQYDQVFSYFQEYDPHPHCFLIHSNAYTLLIAVVLSAQATDKSVNKIMPELIHQADTPEKMLLLGREKVLAIIKSIGLYQRKADYLLLLSQQLIDNYKGDVPSNREELMALAGVGRKTANVVLNSFFGQSVIPVDTHIFRVAQRLGLAHGKTPEEIESQLEKHLPPQWIKNAHYWLITHGRTFCRARSPLCTHCPFLSFCPYALSHTKSSL